MSNDLDKLAGERGVRPVQDISELRASEPLREDDFAVWVTALLLCRGTSPA